MDEKKILIDRVRKELLKDDIKLWLPPYTQEGNEKTNTLPQVNPILAIYREVKVKIMCVQSNAIIYDSTLITTMCTSIAFHAILASI